MMTTVTVWKDTQRRCNPFASYTSADGTRHTKVPADLYEEAVAPDAPLDFSYDTYTVQEIYDAPYVIYTKKPAEQLAAIRWNKLKALRDEKLLHGGCKVADKWFHSDTHSKLQQLSLLISGANLPAGIPWKTMDGSFIELTPLLVSQLYIAQMQQEQAIFLTAEAKKLDTSAVEVGWPETYNAA